MGNTRKVSTSQIEADADKDLLRVSQAFAGFSGAESNPPLRRRDPAVSLQHLPALRNRHSPATYRSARKTVEDRLRKFAEDRQASGDGFPLRVPWAVPRRGPNVCRGLYNPADYPPADEIAREFGLSWQYVSFRCAGPTQGHLPRRCGSRSVTRPPSEWLRPSSEIQQVLRQSMGRI